MFHKGKESVKVKRVLLTFLLTFFLSFNLVSASTPAVDEIYLYSGIFIVILILLWIGYSQRSYLYQTFAGFMLVVTGVYTYINGAGYDQNWLLPTNTTLVTDAFTSWSTIGNNWVFYCSLILIGLGLYYFIVVTFMNIWSIKDKQEEEF